MKDSVMSKISQSSYISDMSIFLLMLSSLFNYLYISRLFFKIFFGDKLSFYKTYFNLSAYSGGVSVVKAKNFKLKTWHNPVLYLFFYLVILESNFFIFSEYTYLNETAGSFNIDDNYINNTLLKYLSLSNMFFYFLIFFLWLKVFV